MILPYLRLSKKEAIVFFWMILRDKHPGLLGTKDIVKDKKTNVYPNPFKDNLSLQSDEKIQNIKVFDISGRFVFKKEISAYKKEINLSFLKPGVYSIEIQKPEATEHIKVIKEE
jgi:hypothetical protein